jgi:DNA helicase-2/ATP-dependent DNA helicase PcrA
VRKRKQRIPKLARTKDRTRLFEVADTIEDMSLIVSDLNDKQKEAVTHTGSPLMILAGAGSGKTRVLTYRAAWLIEERKIPSHSILLLTFTNKAANEMKERMKQLIGTAPAFAGTFHSFAVRFLRTEADNIGLNKNFVIYDDADQKMIIKNILDELNIDEENSNPGSILGQISEAKNQMITPQMYSEFAQGNWQETLAKIYKRYETELRKASALDFDDLLLQTVDALKKFDEIRQRWQHKFQHILVDEWQDTNKIQYTMMKLLVSNNENITAVGDASQSIYSWRGADYRNINNFLRDFHNTTVINLEQNYRSTQIILDAANAIITKNTSHPVLSLWTDNPKGDKIAIYTAKNGFDEASYLADEVRSLKTVGYAYKDIAVLYRTNAQSRVIEESLLHAGIPYILIGGVKFYDRAEIKDLLAYLRLLVNPNDTVAHTRVEKIGVKRLQNFEKLKDDIGDAETYQTQDLLDKIITQTGYLEKFAKETEENYQKKRKH